MGTCCENVQGDNLEDLQIALNLSTKKDYELVTLHGLPYLQRRIQQSAKTNQQLHSIAEGKEAMRHKNKNIYYLGEWDAKGYPKGRGIQYKIDQYIYYGDFDSVPSGKGIYQSLRDKFIYEGEFRYGEIEGHGKMTSTSHFYSFQGLFNNKSQLVTGTATIDNLQNQSNSYTVVLNNYPQAKAKIVYKDGRQYQGEISYTNYAPQGHGVAKFLNGSSYEGKWENGEYHGEGKFKWIDGSCYEGNYQHGKKKGFGTLTYASKKVYKGNWEDGVQQGQGVLLDSQGKTLKKGIWSNGKLYKRQAGQ